LFIPSYFFDIDIIVSTISPSKFKKSPLILYKTYNVI
jgi:hypothetical protein